MRDFDREEAGDESGEDGGVLRYVASNSRTPVHARCPSLSCSDKIMLWNVVGVQGAILSLWYEPVYISEMVVELREVKSIKGGLNIRRRVKEKDIKERILRVRGKRIGKKFRLNEPRVVYARRRFFSHSKFHPSRDEQNRRVNEGGD